MKKFKKILSLMLALTMCLALAIPAFAVQTVPDDEQNSDIIARKPEYGYPLRRTPLYRDLPFESAVGNEILMQLQPGDETFQVISYEWDDKQDSTMWVYVYILTSRDPNCVGWRGYVKANDVQIYQ